MIWAVTSDPASQHHDLQTSFCTLTGLQSVRNSVKHSRVEVRVQRKVGGRVVAGSYKDRVPLRDGDIDDIDVVRLHIDTIDLDDFHVVPVDVEVRGGERSRVDDAKAISLARLEGQRRVFVEANGGRSPRRRRAGQRGEVIPVLREVDEARVCQVRTFSRGGML